MGQYNDDGCRLRFIAVFMVVNCFIFNKNFDFILSFVTRIIRNFAPDLKNIIILRYIMLCECIVKCLF